MEEGHYHHHHHHHHHHGHHTTQSESESIDQRAETTSGISTDQQAETISRISDQHADNFSRTSEQQQQQYTVGPAPAPVLVDRPPNVPSSGVQPTSSFHSVSSMDSSAEMAKYFPGAQTPGLSPFRHHQEDDDQQTQSVATTTTAFTNTNTVASGPYINVPGPQVVQQQQQQQQYYQSTQAPAIIPQPQQAVNPAKPQPPSGIPSYSSQIEGISVSQTVVNDILIDLQTKVINDTQQQYQNDSSSESYFEPLSPIYIRAPNPTIILQSDLQRLRAQLAAQKQQQVRPTRGLNQFQRPSFPAPH